MPDLHTYEVGRPFIPGQTSWPDGTAAYNYQAGQHALTLFLGSPSHAEVADARIGKAEFGLVVEPPVLFLLYRFGRAIPWSDAPYTWHMASPERRTIPDTTGLVEPRALLSVVLVDAHTGIIRALRAVSFSPALTAALHLAIREQAEAPWVGQVAYDAALAELYRRYPSSRDLLKLARARTPGGR